MLENKIRLLNLRMFLIVRYFNPNCHVINCHVRRHNRIILFHIRFIWIGPVVLKRSHNRIPKLELRMRKRKKSELKKRKIIKNKIRLANKKLATNFEKGQSKVSSPTNLSRSITDFIFPKCPKSISIMIQNACKYSVTSVLTFWF